MDQPTERDIWLLLRGGRSPEEALARRLQAIVLADQLNNKYLGVEARLRYISLCETPEEYLVHFTWCLGVRQ